ncbi:MAG: hypothetical protein JXX14_17300 [Deltaproteobacteria bacterium]|nr:hypothetical protein [Deltaproteobacteria bacterium]
MRKTLILFNLIWLMFALSCADNDNRCGDYELDTSGVSCIVPQDTAIVDTNDTSPPPVLGEACASDADCTQYNADYCVLIPGTAEGFCSVRDCTVSPDSCPDEYTCCDTINKNDWPIHCMPTDFYAQYGDTICVN